MNPFSNTTNETSPKDKGSVTSRFGSGAEQDRHESHFGIGTDGLDRLKKFADLKGVGSEQDRYQAHFGFDQDKVKDATQNLLNRKGSGSEVDRYESHFGLGNDGWERAKKLASMKGVGSEQVCVNRGL